jgi:hypothetical protein
MWCRRVQCRCHVTVQAIVDVVEARVTSMRCGNSATLLGADLTPIRRLNGHCACRGYAARLLEHGAEADRADRAELRFVA